MKEQAKLHKGSLKRYVLGRGWEAVVQTMYIFVSKCENDKKKKSYVLGGENKTTSVHVGKVCAKSLYKNSTWSHLVIGY